MTYIHPSNLFLRLLRFLTMFLSVFYQGLAQPFFDLNDLLIIFVFLLISVDLSLCFQHAFLLFMKYSAGIWQITCSVVDYHFVIILISLLFHSLYTLFLNNIYIFLLNDYFVMFTLPLQIVCFYKSNQSKQLNQKH